MKHPRISVIVPAHNNATTIQRALESICQQTYLDLEIIVVDDHSTDDTKSIVEEMMDQDPRISYLTLESEDPDRFDKRLNRNVNAGYAARNFGFTHATGTYITFQDADDVSLRNRIELQHDLLQRLAATHLCIMYLPLIEAYVGKTVDAEAYLGDHPDSIIDANTLYTFSQKAKGLVAKISPPLSAAIPFNFKRLRIINHLFFGSLAPYPGAGNSPLFHRDVLQKVQFRRLRDRIWPSFMGRGADRDFNFQVAETFKNSYVVLIPAYLWDNRSHSRTDPAIQKYLS